MSAFIFFIIIFIVLSLIVSLPTITINSSVVIASSAFAYIRAALYFIPTGTCAAILSIILGLWIIRVIVSLVKTIWALLPVA